MQVQWQATGNDHLAREVLAADVGFSVLQRRPTACTITFRDIPAPLMLDCHTLWDSLLDRE